MDRCCLLSALLIFLVSQRQKMYVKCFGNQSITLEDDSRSCQLQPLLVISFIVNGDAHALPYFLGAIERLDYPKSSISLWIRSKQHKNDHSSAIIERWLIKANFYHSINYKNECLTKNLTPDIDRPLSIVKEYSMRNIDRFLCQQEALEDVKKIKADFLFIINPNVILTRPSVIKDLMLHKDMYIVGPKIERTTWDNTNIDLLQFTEMLHFSNPWQGTRKTIVEVMAVMHAILINLGFQQSERLTFAGFDYYAFPHPLSNDVVLLLENIRDDKVFLYQDNSETFGYASFNEPDAKLEDRLHNFRHLKMQVMYELSKLHFKALLPSDILAVTSPPKSRFDFDKIYMINLAKRNDRLKKMEYCLHELGIEMERFEAFDGRYLNRSVLDSFGVKQLDGYLDPYYKRPLKLGEVGCFLSHYKIWQDLVRNGYEKVLIFEDDIRFRPNFEKNLQKFMKELNIAIPQWELFYLGRKILMPFEEIETISDNIVLPSYSYWTIGYAINSKGAKKLIDEKPLSKMVALDEYLSIMFNRHPNQDWLKAFSNRTLVAASANPLLIDPVGMENMNESDTESSDILPDNVLKRHT